MSTSSVLEWRSGGGGDSPGNVGLRAERTLSIWSGQVEEGTQMLVLPKSSLSAGAGWFPWDAD